MKIAVNTRVLLKGRMEGVCRYIHETTKRLVLAHPEHEFVFFFDRPFHPTFIYASNVTPVVLPPPARDPILWKIWFDFSVARALRKYEIDVFLSGDTYLCLKTEVPTVLVSHDIAYVHFPEHLPARTLRYYEKNFPAFHRKASHIIAVSEFTKQDIIKAYNLPEDKISVAYNAVPKGFKPIPESEKDAIRKLHTGGQPFFIYVGSIHPRKNVARMMQAFLRFKAKGHAHKLVILGRKAWNYNEIDEMFKSSRDVVFLEGKDHDPRTIVPAAEALVYVSLHEGFGIPILEGMSAGVPVITSEISSMSEVAGDAAILVDPCSVDSIIGGFEKVIGLEDMPSLIKKGHRRVKDFDWDASAQVIYRAIEGVVGGKNK